MNCRKEVVYSIPCAECPQTYIGQTVRSLDHLLHEHRHVLKNGDVAASAIAENVYSANHQVHLSKATLVDAHPHTQTSCMLESWHIQHHAPGHLQQREGHHARTLYILAGLNIAILFSPFLLVYLYSCNFKFRTAFLACCTHMPHVTTSLFVCPVCIYTSLPVSVNNLLRTAAVGAQNV